ncbi:MAG: TetR family transcriptional regulator [Pseudomonadota bacterium]
MARRTKEDALATRSLLLDAAEQLFHAQGVWRTSLNDIAVAAGTTRGAIYWHFRDKADLFNAMMERVTLPLEESVMLVGEDAEADPLDEIRTAIHRALQMIATDARARRVFEIAMHRVEYVDEFMAVKAQHLAVRNECLLKIEAGLRLAAERRGAKLALPARAAAIGLHALCDGLIQNWLLDPAAFELRSCGVRAADAYLAGIGLALALPRTPVLQ